MRAAVPALVALAALVVLAPPTVPALAGDGVPADASGTTQGDAPNPCAGRIASPANGTTVISVQGAKMGGPDAGKRNARIVGVGPEGDIRWVHRAGREHDIVWSYDVDPLPDGRLFVTATRPRQTVFYALDPRTGEIGWSETLDLVDTHDADLLDDDRILIANMRNYDAASGENRDRLLVYDRAADAVTWEWRFEDRFPRGGGGNYTDDWTHVNDVDAIGGGRYLASVRNFDQVIVVNRSTGEIDARLGADDAVGGLREQHNPQYVEGAAGRPTILVADSDNGRIVEFVERPGGWERTWELGDPQVFAWPRDADRLPNGNTLIADSRNHRVLEVTPAGEVVWEFYAPWLVYDVERIPLGDEGAAAGDLPAIRDLDAEGTYPARDAAPLSNVSLSDCADALRTFDGDDTASTASNSSDPSTPSDRTRTDPATTAAAADPTEETTAMTGQPGFGIGTVVTALLALALLARRYRRR